MALLKIHLDKIKDNLFTTMDLCAKNHVNLVVVPKCCGRDTVILDKLAQWGVRSMAETMPQHLDGVRDAHSIETIALHVFPSRIRAALRCDGIYVTRLNVLEMLAAAKGSVNPRFIIALEFGDLREGLPPRDLIPFLQQALKIPGIRIAGFSTNFGCMAETLPSAQVVDRFVRCVREAEAQCHFQSEIISIGGSVLWRFLESERLPDAITEIRIGESIFIGYDPGRKMPIAQLWPDAFILESEILEVREVEVPVGNTGSLELRKRALLDIGYTTSALRDLTPLDISCEFVDTTQYLMVVDVTHTREKLSEGDSIRFLLNYQGLAKAMISPYVKKVYL